MEGSTQTEEDSARSNYVEAETQTVDENEPGVSIETQTARIETADQDTATVSATTVVRLPYPPVYKCRKPSSKRTWSPLPRRRSRRALPSTPMFRRVVASSSSPGYVSHLGTEVETKNIRIQTPSPVIEMRTVQTDVFVGSPAGQYSTPFQETRKSPSKMSSAKKKLRRAFAKPMKPSGISSPAMSDWKVCFLLFHWSASV